MLRKDFKKLLTELKTLTRTQQQRLLSEVKDKSSSKSVALIESNFEGSKHCPHCNSLALSRWGKSNDLQRYKCKDCYKTFKALTGCS